MRRFRSFHLAFLFVAWLAAPFCLRGEKSAANVAPANAVPIVLGHSVVALTGPWKFHIGDNLKWADPNFDDSNWETVDLTPKAGAIDPVGGLSDYVPGWTTKGHPGYWGYAWYRIRVRAVAQHGERLALTGPSNVDDAYQVFVNGALLGSFGKFRGPGQRPVVYTTQPQMFVLPEPISNGGGSARPDAETGTQVMAFRVWMEPYTLTFQPDAGGFHSAPLLGEDSVVAAHYKLGWLELVRGYGSTAIEAALFFLLAFVACSLVLFDRSDPVYLWLAAVFLLMAISNANDCFVDWTQVESVAAAGLIQDVLLSPLILGGWVTVWWVWFRLRRPPWIPKTIAALTLLYMVSSALGKDIFFTVVPHSVSLAFHIVSLGIRLLFLLLLAAIVVWGVRQHRREGWLALPAAALVGIALFQFELSVLHVRTIWFPGGVGVGLGDICFAALAAVISVLLLRRLMVSVRRQRELALDVRQAQEVQQVLIPEELPHVPGLAIESEYRPAREVGGDFFQIIPHSTDGSVLIVVGDVTGHGLQAGMLVALIVGAIRSTSEMNADPSFVLNALNRRLCGRGHAHATCLALRIGADGAVRLANAGHLPPYLNGKELPMEGALPLGMMEGAEFSLLEFQMGPGDGLMLLSDGIAEAQNAEGELFGFERIREMLRKPLTAAEVAAAAQNFGQEDDISVLRVVRIGVSVDSSSGEPAFAVG